MQSSGMVHLMLSIKFNLIQFKSCLIYLINTIFLFYLIESNPIQSNPIK